MNAHTPNHGQHARAPKPAGTKKATAPKKLRHTWKIQPGIGKTPRTCIVCGMYLSWDREPPYVNRAIRWHWRLGDKEGYGMIRDLPECVPPSAAVPGDAAP